MSDTSQKSAFLKTEGDRYYQRNRGKLASLEQAAARDRVLGSIKALGLRPRSILEVGCSNGWRLEALRREYGAACHGIDPSAQGIDEGQALFPRIALQQATADSLPFDDSSFDLVIFGFCLYLCDRRDLFKIAYEADRVLQDRGHIAILDFHPSFAYRNEYSHRAGISSYKMNYADLFSWNRSYAMASQLVFNEAGRGDLGAPDERVSVSVLYKNSQYAYPESPFAERNAPPATGPR